MTTKQAHSTALARFVMSVLLCAWTNVFAQPCQMPMEAGDNAPPAIEHGQMSHEMHDAGNDPAEACDHCGAVDESASRLCAAGINASCGESPETGPDNRKSESKFKISVHLLALHAHPGAGSRLQPDGPAVPIDPALLKYDPAPPLSVQFCVYLK